MYFFKMHISYNFREVEGVVDTKFWKYEWKNEVNKVHT